MDLLTKAEFEAGFGSHTPMFSGQTKCVRYYMNFERALRLMKEVIAQEGHTFDANNKPGTLLHSCERQNEPINFIVYKHAMEIVAAGQHRLMCSVWGRGGEERPQYCTAASLLRFLRQ